MSFVARRRADIVISRSAYPDRTSDRERLVSEVNYVYHNDLSCSKEGSERQIERQIPYESSNRISNRNFDRNSKDTQIRV